MHTTKLRFRIFQRIQRSSYRGTKRIGNIVPSSLPSRDDSLGKRQCAVRVCITVAARCERMHYAQGLYAARCIMQFNALRFRIQAASIP